MATFPPQPSSPTEWKQYAESDVVTSVPLRSDEHSNEHPDEQNTFVRRDIYMDESSIQNQKKPVLYIYTDVLALTESELTISPPPLSNINITTRVLTVSTPTHLNLDIGSGNPAGGAVNIYIYAQLLDQPITVSKPGGEKTELELGGGSKNVGVQIVIEESSDLTLKYRKSYPREHDPDRQASLETQLRIALALFWRQPSIAISLCTYVASVTGSSALYPEGNTQAVALGQQLAAQAMTGPNMSYAPVLNVNAYQKTVNTALDAVEGFEVQYDWFHDRAAAIEDQIKVWDAMIDHAQTQQAVHLNASSMALGKYNDACEVVARCQKHLRADNEDLEAAAEEFQKGLERWEAIHIAEALFYACKSVLMIATGLGWIALFDSDGAIASGFGALSDGYNELININHVETETDVKVKPSTLQDLIDCMRMLESLYPSTNDMVALIEQLVMKPDADIPALGGVAGGDADSRTIIAIAAWDNWRTESVDQVETAVVNHIGGAAKYRLAVEKQAVDGKALVQAEAEAVRAGYEYIAAAMEVIACMKDIKALKELKAQYNGEEKIYAQAAAKFYSRFLAIQTSLTIEMRKLLWAYKYDTLLDSRVELGCQKRSYEFRNDLLVITTDIETADEHYGADYQPFKFIALSNRLPSNYGDIIIAGLKGETSSASFTLAPRPRGFSPKIRGYTDDLASVFKNGSHFRLQGLEVFLRGVVPRPEAVLDGSARMNIQITTSGVYADIHGDDVLYFTSLPQSRVFSYEVSGSGDRGRTVIHAAYETQNYAEPTPFTQWTIKILNPWEFDLRGLTTVELEWTGTGRFRGATEVSSRGVRGAPWKRREPRRGLVLAA